MGDSGGGECGRHHGRARCQSIAIAQGNVEIKATKEQLGELADKLYFLDMAFQADAETIVEALCAR